jgi:hypothetical protein
MSKLEMSTQGKPLSVYNKDVMVQIGWLGQTGEVYKLHRPPTSEEEPGSYTPIYMSIGQWEGNEEDGWTIHD